MSHDLRVRLHKVSAIACAGALIVGLLGALPGRARADTAQTACGAMDPFTPALAAELAARWPGQRFSASIYDQRTGCQFDLRPDLRLTTASVLVKVPPFVAVTTGAIPAVSNGMKGRSKASPGRKLATTPCNEALVDPMTIRSKPTVP